jgi:hypothetical protein
MTTIIGLSIIEKGVEGEKKCEREKLWEGKMGNMKNSIFSKIISLS